MLAEYTGGGWRFIAPLEGMSVYVRSVQLGACYRNGAWVVGALHANALVVGGQAVVGSQAAPISEPTGGTMVDVQCRTTIGQILVALRQHGLIATSA